jgi:hypothetical protein
MAHVIQTRRTSMLMRAGAATGAAVLAALTLAACGDSGNDATAADNAREEAQDGALKFARCMRGEGLDFPDPQIGPNGTIRIGPRPGASGKGGSNTARPNFRPDDPKFRAAMEKCRKHLRFGGGERLTPAQQAKARDAFLKFARCMRANGVNVPDPKPGGGAGFVMRAGSRGINPDSPKFRAAQQKCRSHLADIRAEFGVRGGPR